VTKHTNYVKQNADRQYKKYPVTEPTHTNIHTFILISRVSCNKWHLHALPKV